MMTIDPIAFHILGWPIRWYGLSYVAAFYAGWFFMKTYDDYFSKKFSLPKNDPKFFDHLINYCVIGIIIGGRLGHMFFYDLERMLIDPLSIFKVWEGGMAFHGGLLGCVVAGIICIKKYKMPLSRIADLMAIATTPGLFFVRIANFINQELYGTITDGPMGIIFQGQDSPRHPSQLYEAFLEGILLFIILHFIFTKKTSPKNQGLVCSFFFMGYGIARFFVEYVREPLDGIFNIFGMMFSYGQILTLPMIFLGGIIYLICARKNIRSSID